MRKGTIIRTVLVVTLALSLLGCSKKPSTIPETEMSSVTVESTENTAKEKDTETGASTEATTEKETKTEKESTSSKTEETTTANTPETETTTEAATEGTTTIVPTEVATTVAPTTEATTTEGVTEVTTTEASTEEVTEVTTTQPEPTTQPTTEAPKHEHSYTSQVTKEATCSSEGVLTYTCSCGHSYTESIPMLSHSFGDYVYNNNATTESDGTKTRACSTCGYQETVTAEGTRITEHTHNYSSLTHGNYGNGICTICGEETWVYLPIPEESCPYPLHQVIDNGDGTYSLYYVTGNETRLKYGFNTLEGDWAMADFHAFCDRNYLEIGFYAGMGDYKEGVIIMVYAVPY